MNLIVKNGQFTPYYVWKNYKILDVDGNVEELDIKQNIKAFERILFSSCVMLITKTTSLSALLKVIRRGSVFIVDRLSAN